MDLSNQQILVIGGNSGIGKETVAKLFSAGAQLTVAARSPDAGALNAQSFDATDIDAKLDLPDALDAAIYFPGTIKLKRDPKQVADMVAFLVSDSAQSITGQVFGIDGGLSSIHKF